MSSFQDSLPKELCFNNRQDELSKYIVDEAKKLGCSESCAADVVYFRTRSRWNQADEDELIRRDRAGEPAPNMCEYPS